MSHVESFKHHSNLALGVPFHVKRPQRFPGRDDPTDSATERTHARFRPSTDGDPRTPRRVEPTLLRHPPPQKNSQRGSVVPTSINHQRAIRSKLVFVDQSPHKGPGTSRSVPNAKAPAGAYSPCMERHRTTGASGARCDAQTHQARAEHLQQSARDIPQPSQGTSWLPERSTVQQAPDKTHRPFHNPVRHWCRDQGPLAHAAPHGCSECPPLTALSLYWFIDF